MQVQAKKKKKSNPHWQIDFQISTCSTAFDPSKLRIIKESAVLLRMQKQQIMVPGKGQLWNQENAMKSCFILYAVQPHKGRDTEECSVCVICNL